MTEIQTVPMDWHPDPDSLILPAEFRGDPFATEEPKDVPIEHIIGAKTFSLQDMAMRGVVFRAPEDSEALHQASVRLAKRQK